MVALLKIPVKLISRNLNNEVQIVQNNLLSSIFAFSLGGLALIIFIVLVAIAKLRLHRFTNFDIALTTYARNFHPVGAKFFVMVDRIGNIFTLMFVVAVIVVALYLHGFKTIAWWLSINIIAIACFINPILKLIVHRPRPSVKHLVKTFGYSFPSGHASGSMIIFGSLITIVPLLNWSLWLVLVCQLICVALIVIIGVSRVYLGVHYATDVIAGYLEALAWICLTYPYFLNILAH